MSRGRGDLNSGLSLSASMPPPPAASLTDQVMQDGLTGGAAGGAGLLF